MKLPGFTAQNVFPAANRHNLVVGALPPKDVNPIINKAECIENCIISKGGSMRSISKISPIYQTCNRQCTASEIRDPPHKNSWFEDFLEDVGDTGCKIAKDVWMGVCIGDCAFVTGPLAPFCVPGCIKSADELYDC
jgi:hypothetical protein